MPRRARITVVNAPHHVFQRTLNDRAIFYTDKDRQKYIEILSEQARAYKFDIISYCLMKNTIYLVGVPKRKDSLAKTVGRTNFSYTHYINNRRSRSGQLWRNRFQSCVLDENYLKKAVNFVENQPVFGKQTKTAQDFEWSSAQAHISGEDPFGLISWDYWPTKRSKRTWAKFLDKGLSEDDQRQIRMFTQTGRPLGSDDFVAKLEKKFRTRLRPLPVGRPRKQD